MTTDVETPKDIREGNQGLLGFGDEFFLVSITKIDNGAIEATFPGDDYPVDGMDVTLEFHDYEGVNRYPVKVLRGPRQPGEGVRLSTPDRLERVQYRSSFRVPTDLTVQIKESAHVRRYDGDLINVSAGGALVRTVAGFELNTTAVLTLNLPGEPNHSVQGQVVHVSVDANKPAGKPQNLYGLRFVTPEPSVTDSIQRYLSRRLREIYL